MEKHDEWVRVERTSAFKQLMRKKKAFIIPAMIFFIVFYFTLPFLTAFTTVLNGTAFGPIVISRVVDATGAYTNALYIFAAIMLASTVVAFIVRLPKATRHRGLVPGHVRLAPRELTVRRARHHEPPVPDRELSCFLRAGDLKLVRACEHTSDSPNA